MADVYAGKKVSQTLKEMRERKAPRGDDEFDVSCQWNKLKHQCLNQMLRNKTKTLEQAEAPVLESNAQDEDQDIMPPPDM